MNPIDPHPDATPDDAPAVAVIGLAGRFPGAPDVATFWRNLTAGEESLRTLTEEELLRSGVDPAVLGDRDYVPVKGVLDNVDGFDAHLFGVSPREAQLMDPQFRLFLECSWEALENAGYDPSTFDGPIGLFGGGSLTYYLLNNLYSRPDLVDATDPLLLRTLNDKDCLTTLVSYKLGLRGPGVTVQTTCSTSLVAVHLACDSLLDYQCDMALAGGVTVRVPHLRGYRHRPGSILSPDGHCRAFSHDARGTVGGNGAGLVVLKRLEEALEGGDRVLAVIRGSAINNDGSAKVAFTAPSVEGQARVISDALAQADVDPATIGYVEAHGTGTEMGDPIEVEALTRAYRVHTDRRGYCKIGSVKSNIGHLDAAAGVAGLIKTVLALEHRTIPQTLHATPVNPKIRFEETPFEVAARTEPWAANGTPRRAGVSSFGVGGTNAHLVVEEAPAVAPPPAEPRPLHLFCLSARTPSALRALEHRLASHLDEHPDLDPADVAFTLQAGRRRLPWRRTVVAGSARDAARRLVEDGPRIEGGDPASALAVAYLLPGQGSQHPGMAAELYRAEPAFRQAFDACARHIDPLLGVSLAELVFAEPGDPESSERLQSTQHAQPALFAVEVALARLWESWGIRPAALLGHSLGEWVAAHLAGVFSLEDACRLVTLRGRWMAHRPTGAMLTVRLPAAETEARLAGRGLSLAAVNAPELCVVSGPEDEIDALTRDLDRDGVGRRRLHTSHAFHSPAMEPVAEAVAEAVEQVERHAPEVPFLSNVTGTWITDREATSPRYWARHVLAPVRFADALAALLERPGSVLLEVGPCSHLSTLARGQSGDHRARVLGSTLAAPDRRGEDLATLLRALGRVWTAGGRPDWSRLYQARRRRLALPTYPFERRRFWIEAAPRGAVGASPPIEDAAPAAAAEPTAEAQRPGWLGAYKAPSGTDQARMVEIWEAVLQVERIGADDDFFELGGHSLLATQVIGDVRSVFGRTLSLQDLYESPTPATLASRLAAGSLAEDTPEIRPDGTETDAPFPLTDVQQAYWLGRSGAFELGSVATHWYIETEGVFDVDRLERAWQRLVERHGMLRAVFLPDGRQRILPPGDPYRFERLDLRGLPDEAAEERMLRVREDMSHQVRDAERGPLYDVRVSLWGDDRVRLHFSIDLLLVDAWSFVLLGREWNRLYESPELALEPLGLSFRDYVLAEDELREGALHRRAESYWQDRLDDLPPAPQLPQVQDASRLDDHRFERRRGHLPLADWRRLEERAQRRGLTPSGIVLAAFAEVLAGWCKSPRFTLNLTLFNRQPLHPDVSRLLGDFTSLVLLAVDATANATFESRARALQKQLWADLDHRQVSGVWVMRQLARRQGGARRALMPVVFTSTLGLQSGSRRTALPGETVYSISQTPQVWLDFQVAERADGLRFNWDTVDALFPPGFLDTLFDAYLELLERLSREDAPWSSTARVDLLPRLAEATRWVRGPAPETPVGDRPGLLQDGFLDWARRQPERPALLDAAGSMSYGELAAWSMRIGRALRRRGAGPEELVAVVAPKGRAQIAATLGVLLAGSAYLPIDPDTPPERLRFLLDHGRVRRVVADGVSRDRIAWPGSVEVLAADGAVVRDEDDTPLAPAQSPDDLAYVLFTSGSTGRPKGVMIEHRAARVTLDDILHRFGVGADDRVLALSALHFDLSVFDIFGLLSVGGAVVLPDPGLDPGHWLDLAREHRVTVWNSVPALLRMEMDLVENHGVTLPASLRLVLLSGDWIPVGLPDQVRARGHRVEIVSLGGATEASIWSIFYPVGEVAADWRSIPYGRPLSGQGFHVLDASLEPRPVWAVGDLYISGRGLARGYWRDEERTGAAFVTHPVTGEALYRTGDLGRWLPDGQIEFLGREDTQVKVQGHRIELAEIEHTLRRHPRIRAAVVLAPGARDGGKRLVGYLEPEDDGGGALDLDQVQTHLADWLPTYMRPTVLLELEALPLSPNGKIDRSRLPEPDQAATAGGSEDRPPESPIEEALAEVWGEVLGRDRIGAHDDFFALGGDSLTATRVYLRLREVFPVEVPLASLFEWTTIAGLAEHVDALLMTKLEEMPDDEAEVLLG